MVMIDWYGNVLISAWANIRNVGRLASFPGLSQIWSCSCGEKLVEGLVPLLHQGLELWTWFVRIVDFFRNDGNMPMQEAASTASDLANSFKLHKYQVANKGCVDISRRRFTCWLKRIGQVAGWEQVRHFASKQVSELGPLSSSTKKQMVRLLVAMYKLL